MLVRRSLDWIDISTSFISFQGTATSIYTSFNWLVSYVVPLLGDAINPFSCFFIFAGIALVGTRYICSACRSRNEMEDRRRVKTTFQIRNNPIVDLPDLNKLLLTG